MRHRKAGRKLNRTAAHRRATGRNLVSALFEQFGEQNREYVVTTLAKAKEYRSLAERLITLAKKAIATATPPGRKLALRRRVYSLLGAGTERIIAHGGTPKRVNIVKKLFDDIAPRYLDRPGGYTRIIKTGAKRLGNGSQKVLFTFVTGLAPSGGAPIVEPATASTATTTVSSAEKTDEAKTAEGEKTGQNVNPS